MGYKDTIKTILRDVWGIQDRYFEINLSIKNGQELLRDFNPQTVKARFEVSLSGSFKKPVLVDMFVTVWGSIKYEVVYNNLDNKYSSFLNTFIQAIVTELEHDIKSALEQYKTNLKKSA